MKKTTKRLVLAVLLFLLLLLTGYFILAFYYREGFSVNTWINGVYCTGKTVEEVNSELLLRTEAPNIVIVDREGTEYTISLAEADYQADYSNVLEHYRQEQNPFLWVDNVLFHSRRELSPTVTVMWMGFGELMILWNLYGPNNRRTRITALPGIRRASTSSRMDLRDALTWRRLFWRWRTQ